MAEPNGIVIGGDLYQILKLATFLFFFPFYPPDTAAYLANLQATEPLNL
ncbi:MAG: hypothetical protein M3299_00975 [Thermoproteota archaeon]|nr:hypothetical protein [Thermoproteota archaeon]